MNEYYISDPHFGHANILKTCNRPFSSVAEMDEALIANWNARLHADDIVFLLGDVFWNKETAAAILPRLKGKIRLIPGNHDGSWYRPALYANRFLSVETLGLERRTAGRRETLCHYPLAEWHGSEARGCRCLSYLIHGHTHNATAHRELLLSFLALNAGVEINRYQPVTFSELEENNLLFKLSSLPDPEDRAFLLASRYHAHQTDKAGAPYIGHPRAVAAGCPDAESRTVAWLHDTLEDTDLPVSLLRQWFSPEVVAAVELLTRPVDETYEDYIRRVRENPLARVVKLADLAHNMDLSRLPRVTERDLARREKYARARQILLTD